MRERILAIAKNATKDNVSSKFESVAQTKEKTIRGALKSYAKGCPYEDIIAIMDTTVFGGGKEGFLLTEKTLYSDTFKKTPIPLENLVKVEPDKKNHLLLTFNKGGSYVEWFSIYAPQIMNLLQDLINLKLDPDGAGETQNIPDAPDNSDVSNVSETPDTSNSSDNSDISNIPDTPDAPGIPETSNVSDTSDISSDSDDIPVSVQTPEALSKVNALTDEWQAYETEKLAFEKEKIALKRNMQIFGILQQDFKRIKQIFDNEQQIFQKEKQAFEEEKQNLENEKTAFEEENRKLENEKAAFKEEEQNLENERTAFEKEKQSLKNERNAFEEEKLDLLKERQAFEDNKQKLSSPVEEDEEADEEDEFDDQDLFDELIEWFEEEVEDEEEDEEENIAEREKIYAAGVQCYKNKNYDDAVMFFEAAAERGDPDAPMVLAKFYSEGIGVTADPEESFLWLKKAAELGNADAQHAVGAEYLRKENAEDNMEVIEYWFAKAADQGHEMAQKGLSLIRRSRGVAYYNEGIKKIKQPHLDSNMKLISEDLTDALPDLEKAGELGIVEAQSMLASYYIYGNCRFICRILEGRYEEREKTDEEKGLYWLKKAVENEDADAIFTYAKYLFFGKLNCMEEKNFDIGVYNKDYSYTETEHTAKAFEYAVKASDLGCDDADVWIIQAVKNQIPGAQDAMKRTKKDLSGLYETLNKLLSAK